jgi:hypothetical protein
MSKNQKKIREADTFESTDDEIEATAYGHLFSPVLIRELTAKTKSEKYKTELCRNYSERGYCPYRAKCQYAHGNFELQSEASSKKCYRTRRCNSFWKHGVCYYGQRCQFLHHEFSNDTRFFLKLCK